MIEASAEQTCAARTRILVQLQRGHILLVGHQVGLHATARHQIPNTHQSTLSTGAQQTSVFGEECSAHQASIVLQDHLCTIRRRTQVPQSTGAVGTHRRPQVLRLRSPGSRVRRRVCCRHACQAENVVFVAAQHAHLLLGGHVPHAHGAVVGTTDQLTGTLVEAHAGGECLVTAQLTQDGARTHVHHTDLFPHTGGQQAAVSAEGARVDRLLESRDSLAHLVADRVVDLNPCAARDGKLVRNSLRELNVCDSC
mmetsp:Transcript_45319/g.114097  ORF Transcript_45319/g.114097 Transcript_45319/m.114097 type:complete len:253 (-) Transcript_45319:148-906(-)